MLSDSHRPRPATARSLHWVVVAMVFAFALPTTGAASEHSFASGPTAPGLSASPGPRATASPPSMGHPTPAVTPAGWSTQYTLYIANNTLRSGNQVGPSLGRPWYVAYDPTTHELYASVDCTVYVVNPSTFEIVGTLSASGGCGVIYLASTGYLYLSASGNVTAVNPATDTVVNRIRAPEAGQTVFGMFAYDAKANAIIVDNAFSSVANVIGLTQGKLLTNLSVSVYTEDGVYDPVNTLFYYAEYENDVVIAVNSTTWATTSISVSSAGLFDYGVAVDPRTGDIYVTTYFYSTGVLRISGSTNAKLNFSSFGSYLTGIVFDNDSNVVYVVDSETQTVYALNPTNLSIETSFKVSAPGLGIYFPWWPAFVPELNTLYLPTGEQDALIAVNAANDTVYGSIGGLTEPDAAAYDPPCGCLVVGDFLTDNVYFVNASTLSVDRTVHVGGEVRGITYDNRTGQLWVGYGGFFGGSGLAILNAKNGSVVTTLTGGYYYNRPTYDPTDDRMFVAVAGSNEVNVYNATNLTLLQSISDSYASEVAWDPVNDRVYVSDWEANNVTVYDATNGSLVATIQHVPGPNSIVYDLTLAEVVTGDENAANVTTIDPANDTIIANISYAPYVNQLLPVPSSDWVLVSGGVANLTFLNLVNKTSVQVASGSETDALAWTGPETLAATDLRGPIYWLANVTQDLLTTPELTVSPGVITQGASLNLSTNDSGGVSPYSYAYGGLPTGCASANASSLSCTPTEGGSYLATVNVSDAAAHSQRARAMFWVLATYAVTFHAQGLTNGTPWWVNLTGGPSIEVNTTSVTLQEPNGTFRYTVGVSSPWVILSDGAGPLTVAGGAVSVTVTFAKAVPIAFEESGLAGGTTWQVAVVGGGTITGNSSTLQVDQLPGTYTYTAFVPAGGYHSVSGSVDLGSTGATVPVNFTRFLYQLSFLASGLPSGTTWWVNLSTGADVPSAATEAAVEVPNGTYGWVAQPDSHIWRAITGTASVTGGGSAVALTFSLQTYSVGVSASGLPANHVYWVNLTDGTSWFGTAPVGGPATNGSHSYLASAGVGWSTLSGTFSVTGGPVAFSVNFTEQFHDVTFNAVGLSLSAPWSVNLTGGSPLSSINGSIVIPLQNGATIGYDVRGPTNQWPLHPHGMIARSIGAQIVTVEFPPVIAVAQFVASPSSVVVDGTVNLTASGSGGESPLNYSFTGLSALGCNAPAGGTVSCVPPTVGTFTVGVEVSDGAGSYANASVAVSVTAPGSSSSPTASSLPWIYILLGVVAVVAVVAVFAVTRMRGRGPSPSGESTSPEEVAEAPDDADVAGPGLEPPDPA